jgi:antitoxin MazE6
MKTAISIPDEVFSAAERAAKTLGVSRSELYANAVREFVARYGRENITRKLNDVYLEKDDSSKLDPTLQAIQEQSLQHEDW